MSKATASNVFNRPQLVREEVRARVLAAAKAIGYAGPDPRGRMLSAGKVNAIGVATAEPLAYFFEDPFARAMMVGITEACDANGIGISLVSAATEDALAWSIRSAVVDGLILFCLEDADRLVAAARERRLPFVALAFGDTDDDVLGGRRRRRGRARAWPREHLTGLGHRRFAILAMEFGEGDAGRVAMERVEARRLRHLAGAGARATSRRWRPPASTPAACRSSRRRRIPATIDAALEELFAAPEPPTALLAQSDRIAMRALDWLKARGIAVPGDVSVIGFDGVPEGAATDPPLTTISQPIDRARPPRGPGHHRARRRRPAASVLDVELVERASTGPA